MSELVQTLKTTINELTQKLDLPIPPPNLVDLWRIEGEGPDLQLHQAILHFPLIHLRDFLPRVSLCRKPRLH